MKFIIFMWILMIAAAAVFFQSTSDNTGLYPTTDNERINIVFKTEYGKRVVGIVMDNGTSKFVMNGTENPTVIIKCNSSMAKEIVNSDNKISKIVDAILKGDVIVVNSNNSIFSFIPKFSKILKILCSSKL